MVTDINQLDFSKRYTYSDYLTWQFNEMVELIKGKIYKMSPAPSDKHQVLAGNIYGEIFHFLRKQSCKVFHAPYDVRLTTIVDGERFITVVQPDICIICDQTKRDEKGCNGAPDFIVEILSPSTAAKDVREKFDLYEEAGVKEYWIVDPTDELVDVFVLDNGKYRLVKKYVSTDIVPVNILNGFSLDLKDVFEK